MLFAGTVAGVFGFKPRAAGAWEAIGVRLPERNVHTVAWESGGLLAGTRDHGIYRSTDLGDTWSPLPGAGHRVSARMMGVAPDGSVYLGARPAAIHCRLPAAESFQELPAVGALATRRSWNFPAPPNQGMIRNFAFTPVRPQTVYAAVEVGGVLRSDDQGATWTELREGLHLDVHAVACSYEGGEALVFAATGQGFFRSRNAGATWEPACQGLHALFMSPLAAHQQHPTWLFSSAAAGRPRFWNGREGGARARIYRSMDAGDTWTPVGAGLPDLLPAQVEALAFDPFDPDTLYAGCADGKVLMGRDLGDSWSLVAEGLPTVMALSFAPSDSGR